ncbi:uncharacterized protein LOC106132330 [Amyelois transitella]|uniref:uncharacterized protein LOC106132330 n=1 Tax=Amyelois transitella TaxID=680683 RepID=UPI00299015C3|nr:uncharacterized protein LOC106132330 [Amyelois transitella]XP_060803600.1 uncharacterized protein LOC106132330 [Amyelois transitella]
MAQSKVSLSWDAYRSNVCRGLSSLQQTEEFVDMTIAADGHFVKVHQVMLALASPYIKELISSIKCPHPVLFLNKISHTTLGLILEYIYTGQVLVSLENLTDLLVAGRELHIKGLEDMKLHEGLTLRQTNDDSENEDAQDDDVCYFEVADPGMEENTSEAEILGDAYNDMKCMANENDHMEELQEMHVIEHSEALSEADDQTADVKNSNLKKKVDTNAKVMQYTVSNKGSLQMILNRFVYYLKHTNRNNTRQWRCVDYVSHIKCPARVVTKNDMVLQRVAAHIHPFHDTKILKKVRRGAVFSALKDAKLQGTQNNDET